MPPALFSGDPGGGSVFALKNGGTVATSALASLITLTGNAPAHNAKWGPALLPVPTSVGLSLIIFDRSVETGTFDNVEAIRVSRGDAIIGPPILCAILQVEGAAQVLLRTLAKGRLSGADCPFPCPTFTFARTRQGVQTTRPPARLHPCGYCLPMDCRYGSSS